MLPPVLNSHMVYGISPASTNLHFLDDQNIIYPAGSNLVVYNTESRTQRFINVPDGEAITALGLSSNQLYSAVAIRSDKPTVIIYDVYTGKRRKMIVGTEIANREFIAVEFYGDNKFILTLSGAPEWVITLWNWEKNKILASTTLVHNHAQIRHISFNPFDKQVFCVSGASIFRMYKFADGAIKPYGFAKSEFKSFLTHAWISLDRVALATDEGKIQIFDANEMICEIECTEPQNEKIVNVSAILSCSFGLICGTTAGTIIVLEKKEEVYKKVKEILLEASPVVSMVLNANEELFAIGLENRQLYAVTLTGADDTRAEEIRVEHMAVPFHSSAVTSLDTCVRKSIVASCGADNTVRLWNYIENSVEVIKHFTEQPQCVAIHPSGLYLSVGFTDTFRLMAVLIDGVKTVFEANRGAKLIRFSNGGQYFAIIQSSVVQVYSTYKQELIYNWRLTAKVRSLAWSFDDTRISTAGVDGLSDWTIETQRKDGNFTDPYNAVVYSPDGKIRYAIDSNSQCHVIIDNVVTRQVQIDQPLQHIEISRSGKYLFISTVKGSIKVLKLPLDQESIQNMQDFRLHYGPIHSIRLSFDDQYLFSCSEDGCVAVLKVSEKLRRDRESLFSEDILVTKTDIKENAEIMTELKGRVDTLKQENEIQLRSKDTFYGEKIQELVRRYGEEVAAIKEICKGIKEEKLKHQMKHNDELVALQNVHIKEFVDMKTLFDAKLEMEGEKFSRLITREKELKKHYETQMKRVQIVKKDDIEHTEQYYHDRLNERIREIDALQLETREAADRFNETLADIEQDLETETIKLKFAYETKLKEEQDSVKNIKSENQQMKKRFDVFTKDININKAEIVKLLAEEKKLQSLIKSLEKDIQGLRKETEERDDTIVDKEKRIYDLKKKNQELEKFKFVLDYKIQELKKQIEPREKDVSALTEEISNMDEELKKYQIRHSAKDLNIHHLELKLKARQHEAEQAKAKSLKEQKFLQAVQHDLSDVAAALKDQKALKKLAIALHRRYSEDDQTSVEIDPFAKKIREQFQLERALNTLSKKIEKESKSKVVEHDRLMSENVSLLAELNTMRKQNRLPPLHNNRK